MASDTSEVSPDTDISFNVSTTKGAPAEGSEATWKLHSFLCLFWKIGITKIDGEYVIAKNPSVEAWESLFKIAWMIRDLDVREEEGREMAKVSPSLFVRLAQRLKRDFLFPNLRNISIEDLNSSTHYLSLIASPVLENVLLKLGPMSGSADGVTHLTTHIFLGDLVAFSPNLRSLVINCTEGISPLWLDMIARFHHLQTLTLSSLNMKSFGNLRSLGSLTHLQTLSLVFQHQEYERMVPSKISLPQLKYLHIVSPLDVTVDLVQAIGTNDLEIFSFERVYQRSPKSVYEPPLKSVRKPSRMSLKGNKKGSTPTTSEDVSEPPTQDPLLSILSSLWGQSLKELTAISTGSLIWDLTHLAPFRVLEKLRIEESSIPGVGKSIYPPSTLCCCLRSLHLPADPAVTFSFIQQIAESTPFLSDISLSIDLVRDPGVDHVQALFHPLSSMTILRGAIETDSALDYGAAFGHISLLRLIKAARCLNALFPNLERLDAMVQEGGWHWVWELVKLCRDSLADEKGRKQVQIEAVS